MSYSTDIADVLTRQLQKLATLNKHQLAGQLANLDFWLDEVRHCLGVIDGYPARFMQLRSAQTEHVRQHHTVEFAMFDPCCTQRRAEPPRRVQEADLKTARRSLCDAFYALLVRLYRADFIDEKKLENLCESIGVRVDPSDRR